MSLHIAQKLRQTASASGQRVSLAELLRLHGDVSDAVLLMLLALLSLVPMPSAGQIFSIGMMAMAWGWLRGRPHMALPARLGDFTLDERWSPRLLRGLATIYEWAHRWLRPRWFAISHARTRFWWALWIGLMAFVIFLPVPLGNLLPSGSLVLLGLGFLFRDGVALLLSTAMGAAGLGYALALSHLAWAAVLHAWSWLPF